MRQYCSSVRKAHTTARIVPDLTISNPAGSGFGENLLWDHRTIHDDEIFAIKAMLSAVIKRQYSSLFPLLRHCLPVCHEICGMEMDVV